MFLCMLLSIKLREIVENFKENCLSAENCFPIKLYSFHLIDFYFFGTFFFTPILYAVIIVVVLLLVSKKPAFKVFIVL